MLSLLSIVSGAPDGEILQRLTVLAVGPRSATGPGTRGPLAIA